MSRSRPTHSDDPAATPPGAATIGELRASGWRSRSVKAELRTNLLARLGEGAAVFPGVVGYADSVLPAVENAILAGQDMVFLGERGQGKTRLARLLVGLLDPWLPIVAGGELNDDPFGPISPSARALVAEGGDETPISWLARDRRYGEKLATPDITIADLIGEVDPIRVAEGRYLSDERVLHFGLIPRSNRGIFAINELPDLAERIQVGLLNILEERDVQVRGFTIRLPLDLFVVASANPEDYTSRGRIITPLKDRLGSQIRTHYPRTLADEIAIVRQEKVDFPAEEGRPGRPRAGLHRGDRGRADPPGPSIGRDQPALGRQRAGLDRQPRGPRGGRTQAGGPPGRGCGGAPDQRPRCSVVASTAGKIELETAGDESPEDRIVERLITQGRLCHASTAGCRSTTLTPLVEAFDAGPHPRDRRPGPLERVRPLGGRGPGPVRGGPANRHPGPGR